MTGHFLSVGVLAACLASAPLGAEGAREKPAPAADFNVIALKGPTGLGMVKLFESPPELGPADRLVMSAAASPDQAVARLMTGEAALAVLPTNLAANLYNKKAPVRLAAVIGGGVLYLLSSDPSLDGWPALSGRELANTSKGATPDILLAFLLRSKGLADKVLVNFRYGPAELSQLLASGREPAGVLPEPFVSAALRANPKLKLAIDLQAAWSEFAPPAARELPMSALVVGQRALEYKRPAVLRFLEEFRAAQRWVLENPAEAGRLAEKHGLGFPAADAQAAVPRCRFMFVPAGQARPAVEAFLSVFLATAPEALGGRLPDEGFYAF